MKKNLFRSAFLGLVALSASVAPCAHAVVVMDQIGSSGAFFTGDNAGTSQVFSDFPTFSISAVDDFTTSTILDITNVTEATLGFGGFTSYSNITGYEVNIYSSLAAANASLNGNVAHVVLPAAAATVTTPFSGDAFSALVSLPVNILLPSAGKFYVSVLADLTFATGGELGTYVSTGLTGSTPGGANGVQDNPGGGFALAGNTQAAGGDVAYRVTGVAVPEPSAYALCAVGAGLLGGVRRFRRATRA